MCNVNRIRQTNNVLKIFWISVYIRWEIKSYYQSSIKIIYVDFEWATKLNRLTLNIVGIWPNIHENNSDKFLSNIRTIFSLLLFIFVGMIPAMQSLMKTWGDMIATIDNLQFTLPLITTIIKLVIIWWKKPGNVKFNSNKLINTNPNKTN